MAVMAWITSAGTSWMVTLGALFNSSFPIILERSHVLYREPQAKFNPDESGSKFALGSEKKKESQFSP